MIFGKSKLELKVGLFVLTGLIILTAFILLIGNFKTWSSGYRVSFLFNFVNGVKIGAPVRFAGVDVGEVKQIKLLPFAQGAKARAKIVCWVKEEVKIPLDSTVWVNTLGLLGEKYLEIMPGKDYSKCMSANQELAGNDPLPMQEIGELAKRIAVNLDQLIVDITSKKGTVGKLLYDDEIYKELQAAISNKTGTIGRLFYDDTLYRETSELIQDLKKHPWKLFWKTKEK